MDQFARSTLLCDWFKCFSVFPRYAVLFFPSLLTFLKALAIEAIEWLAVTQAELQPLAAALCSYGTQTVQTEKCGCLARHSHLRVTRPEADNWVPIFWIKDFYHCRAASSIQVHGWSTLSLSHPPSLVTLETVQTATKSSQYSPRHGHTSRLARAYFPWIQIQTQLKANSWVRLANYAVGGVYKLLECVSERVTTP